MKFYRLLAVMLLLAAFSGSAFANLAIFERTATIDGNASGSFAGLFIDSSDNLHAAYSSSSFDPNFRLKYAKRVSGTWSLQTIDSNSSAAYSTPAIAVSSTGTINVSYRFPHTGSSACKLKYASSSGSGSWAITEIDNNGFGTGAGRSVACESAMDLNVNDSPVIVYRKGLDNSGISGSVVDSNIWLATLSGGVWSIELVEDLNGFSLGVPGIDVDSAGDIHVCYRGKVPGEGSNEILRYAKKSSGSWSFATVDSNSGAGSSGCSIKADSSGNLHISYRHGNSISAGNLLGYAKFSGSAWHTEVVSDENAVNGNNIIGIDSNNNVVISYVMSDEGGAVFSLSVAKLTNVWNVKASTVTVGSGSHIGAAISSDKNIHFVHKRVSGTDDALRHLDVVFGASNPTMRIISPVEGFNNSGVATTVHYAGTSDFPIAKYWIAVAELLPTPPLPSPGIREEIIHPGGVEKNLLSGKENSYSIVSLQPADDEWVDNGTNTSFTHSVADLFGKERPFSYRYYVKLQTENDLNSSPVSITVHYVPANINVKCADVGGDICDIDNEYCSTEYVYVEDSAFCCSVQCMEKLPDIEVKGFSVSFDDETGLPSSVSVVLENSGLRESVSGFNVEVRKGSASGALVKKFRVSASIGIAERKTFSESLAAVTAQTSGAERQNPFIALFSKAFFASQKSLGKMPDESGSAYFASETYCVIVDSDFEVSEPDKSNNVFCSAFTAPDVLPPEELKPEDLVGNVRVVFSEELFLGERNIVVVTLADGSSLAGLRIDVKGLVSGFTDSRGRFSFSAEKSGSFDFSVLSEGVVVFQSSFIVKTLQVVLEKDVVGVSEIQVIKILDSTLKPVAGATVVITDPKGNVVEFVSSEVGTIEFVPSESGRYSVSVSRASASDSREFTAVSLSSIVQGILSSTVGVVFGEDVEQQPVLVLLLLLLSFFSALIAFLVSGAWFGLQVVSSRLAKRKNLSRLGIALLAFVLPIAVSRILGLQFGVILALLEIIALIFSYYSIKFRIESAKAIKV